MTRSEILSLITSACSPNDISSAMSAARGWLADNPEDDTVRQGMQHLARAERERLS
jgi:hypothetical protein